MSKKTLIFKSELNGKVAKETKEYIAKLSKGTQEIENKLKELQQSLTEFNLTRQYLEKINEYGKSA